MEPIGDLTGDAGAVDADGRRLLDLTSPTSMLISVDIAGGVAEKRPFTAHLVESLPVASSRF